MSPRTIVAMVLALGCLVAAASYAETAPQNGAESTPSGATTMQIPPNPITYQLPATEALLADMTRAYIATRAALMAAEERIAQLERKRPPDPK